MWIKSFVLSIWNVIDPVYYACTRLKCIVQPDGKRSAFRVRLTSFRGRRVLLSDGTMIKRGDTLLKIHLHNVLLLKNMLSIKGEIRKGKFDQQRHVQMAKYVGKIRSIKNLTSLR